MSKNEQVQTPEGFTVIERCRMCDEELSQCDLWGQGATGDSHL